MQYIPGRPVPKQVVRPFIPWYDDIDEKKMRCISPGDKTTFIGASMYIFAVMSVGGLLVWFASDFTSDKDLYIAISLFSAAVLAKLVIKYIKPRQYIIFDRENQIITFPKGTFSSKVLTAPWDDWEARITTGATYSGGSRHTLWFLHSPTEHLFIFDSSVAGIDSLLGIWSFVVQYMDKDGPYPNVNGLKHLKNLTDGVGTYDEWEKKGIAFTSEDPYYTWLEEQKS